MQQLLEDIKSGGFRQVYLLYGEEAYLRLQYRDKLKDALAGGDTITTILREKGRRSQSSLILRKRCRFLQSGA